MPRVKNLEPILWISVFKFQFGAQFFRRINVVRIDMCRGRIVK